MKKQHRPKSNAAISLHVARIASTHVAFALARVMVSAVPNLWAYKTPPAVQNTHGCFSVKNSYLSLECLGIVPSKAIATWSAGSENPVAINVCLDMTV